VREAVLNDPRVIAGILLLGLILLGFGVVARAFLLAFLDGIRDGEPQPGRFRRFLRPGAAHFVWSSLLTLPLYAILFGAEWLLARGAAQRMEQFLAGEAASETELYAILFGQLGGFAAILLPWALLTLPMMVWIYELTPAVMIRDGCGPVEAARRGIRAAAGIGLRGYLALRLLLQVVAGALSTLALLPALLLSALPAAVIGFAGFALSGFLGGWNTGSGGAAAVVTVLLCVAVLYVVLCIVLAPVTCFVLGVPVAVVGAIPRAWTGATVSEPNAPGVPGSGAVRPPAAPTSGGSDSPPVPR
jgi:hypothetical protein